MSIQEVSPERFAQLCHRYRQSLAEAAGSTNSSMSTGWDEIPVQEKSHLVAATRLAFDELLAIEKRGNKRYFAEPGRAEWGC